MEKHVDLAYIKGVLLVAVSAVLWSTGGALIKMTELDSIQVSFWRSFFALITLAALIRPKRISWEWSNLISSLAYAFTLLFFVIGTKLTTAANAIFLQYTAPLYIVIFSYVFFREKFRKGEIFAMVFCVIGITLFFSDQVDFTGYMGMLWSLASGITYACFITVSKKRTRGHYGEPVMLGAFFCMLLSIGLIAGEGRLNLETFSLSLTDFFLIGFLGIFQIGVPCFLYMRGLREVSALEAGIITMVEPISNPVWAYFLVTEIPSVNTLLGGGVMLTAILIHTWQTYSHSRKKKTLSKF